MTADDNEFCPCGCRVTWSSKYQMTLCCHCDLGKQPAAMGKEPVLASKK